MKTKARIEQHEGRRHRPYRCSEGRLTVGIGRNLDAVPFSDDEIELMFNNDYERAASNARKLTGFERLNEVRQGVIIEMVFQMGFEPFDGDGYRDFVQFLKAVSAGDIVRASEEMLDSLWARQTPKRARRLANIFLAGEYDA